MSKAGTCGSLHYPSISGSMPPSTQTEMDKAMRTLHANKDAWVKVSVKDRIALTNQLIHDIYSVMPHLVDAELKAKGLQGNDYSTGMEWYALMSVLRILNSLRRALADIDEIGHPRIPGPVSMRPDGQVIAQVFPEIGYDRIFHKGYTMEVWMKPGVTLDYLARTQAVVYQNKGQQGSVALVLGAGNVLATSFSDVLYKFLWKTRSCC